MGQEQLRHHPVAADVTGRTLGDGVRELGPMDFILLRRGEPHALTALADASALLTICLAH
jgi:hypothetical protein